jgi:hypothetical protein
VTLPTPLDDIANNCIFDAAKGELDCVNEAAMRHTLSTKRIINAEGSAIKVALFAPSLLPAVAEDASITINDDSQVQHVHYPLTRSSASLIEPRASMSALRA